MKMKVHVRKCAFLYDYIKFLGFIINSEGTAADPAKVDAINKMNIPDSVKKLSSFIGTVNLLFVSFFFIWLLKQSPCMTY
jgi:hypothetical protein